MQPTIDHIHITVSDLERAERFYDRFLPLLGFDLKHKETTQVPEHEYRIIEYHHRNFSFGIVNPRPVFRDETVNRRKPGAIHHIAFTVSARAEVDRLYERVREIGAVIVHPPQMYPEYCEDYYAFFFKDPEGIELEIVYLDRSRYFPGGDDRGKSASPEIRRVSASERQAIDEFLRERWFSTKMVVRGRVVDMTSLDGFAAWERASIVGLVTYEIQDRECEIISLDSVTENRGIGTALLNRVILTARDEGCEKVKVVTTNDNVRAILFYQKRGFDMVRLYPNSVDAARKLKPEIPPRGDYDLPIRHEIEFELPLK